MIVCYTSKMTVSREVRRSLKRVRAAVRQSILPAKGLDETVLSIIGWPNEPRSMLGAARRGTGDVVHQWRVTLRAFGPRWGAAEDLRVSEGWSA
jgi:hypothetical protein